MDRFEFRRLKWWTFGAGVAALGGLQLTLVRVPGAHASVLLLAMRALLLVLGVLIFNEYVFGVIGRAQTARDRERERWHALRQISEVSLLPAQPGNLPQSLEIVRGACGAAVVGWLEPRDGEDLDCRAQVGPWHGVADQEGQCGQALAARALRSGGTVVLEEPAGAAARDPEARALLGSAGLGTAAAVCGGFQGRREGVLVVGWRTPHPPSAADLAFLESAAGQLAVSVANLQLYQETRRMTALEERARLARDMHDGLAQALTYLKLKAEAALTPRLGGRPDPQRMEAALAVVRQGTIEALGEVRETIMDLRAPAGPFTPHLDHYLRSWSQMTDIESDLLLPDGPVSLEGDLAVHVLRVVQEALANVRKHANARHVWVQVTHGPWGLCASVADDGRGFDPALAARPGHYGLGILQERAAALGGSVSVRPRSGGGTEVVLELLTPALVRNQDVS